jgi:hypothetical protein
VGSREVVVAGVDVEVEVEVVPVLLCEVSGGLGEGV